MSVRHRQRSSPSRIAAVGHFFSREVWTRELTTLPTFRRFGYKVSRVAYLAGSNFVKDRCTWRASALTYITVLSLVPMLAFAFSVAKGLGVYKSLREDAIEEFLDQTFGPANGTLGAASPAVEAQDGQVEGETPVDSSESITEEGVEPLAEGVLEGGEEPTTISPEGESTEDPALLDGEVEQAEGGAEVRRAIETVLDFVQDTDVASLGVLGLAIVIWTVLQLLGSIERSYNDIWGVRRSRSIARKLSDYLSTLILVPLLLVTATGVANLKGSAAVMSWLGLDAANGRFLLSARRAGGRARIRLQLRVHAEHARAADLRALGRRRRRASCGRSSRRCTSSCSSGSPTTTRSTRRSRRCPSSSSGCTSRG